MKIINKKALHNYHILEHLEAGIVLSGAEVKSIRAGRLDLGESHIRVLNGEAYLVNANISRYNQAADKEYDAQKSRKLLLHKTEIDSLIGKTSGKGTTLVPVSMYEKNNRFKVEVGLAKSKKEFDHRKSIKEKDHARRVEQELRGKE
ncbi:SsrA-binding protein [Candidatus Daviesbacteria bacterium RIFCSPLOWO2_02_FULL_41_8]|uniref:SsrA-binding protein n=2 Tax=Candidatus Daviesiibacteriota TaxID=1752718 RepID=A0A1F5NLU8_9BACT|nr:MAG: SsrA-binding protein [Candidatus Daviesbacteria bacterium RIFCSPHIGHO2_01_FULL_41_23]OGE62244.1 MAG: SsrA-binding protein [Candidatus Daviesbacteria bacterium RIFCSPLOWO2_01_FULL_41_32]OGE78677.1 MAG: SsrA-binding protein [Candidatus Daviesbacteria bacterium RIFCSPLOWO2_02_FULL_41_8]